MPEIKKLDLNDPDTKSADIVAGNIDSLKALFPEAFTEGKIDFEVLKGLLGAAVDERDEKYGLNWHGKRRARQIALTPSTGTLLPCPDESVDWDTTQNLMIEGDNLEVLKLLQKSYAGKVKLIYIDPPYNTGGDFVYEDDFVDNIKNYKSYTGQLDADGRRITSNPESSGRYHTDWLSMMYPRLKLSRMMLADDGLLVCHMDEHELANAEKLFEEIFGAENILGIAVWDKRNPKGDATRLAYQHEVILFVAKDQVAFASKSGLVRKKKNATAMLAKAKQLFARMGQRVLPADLKLCADRHSLPASCVQGREQLIDLNAINAEFAAWVRAQDFSGGEAAYNKIDEDGDVYRLVSMAWPNKKRAPDEYFIPLIHPVTNEKCPVPERGWRNPPDTMKKLREAGEIIFGADHSVQPQRKYLLKSNVEENFPSILAYGGSDDALLSSMGIPFDTPKPVDVARELISATASKSGIVMDFFSGSGTAGHAVMAQNAIDGGTRRFVLVQLPEPLDPTKPEQKAAAAFCGKLGKAPSLSEITKERLRRAAKKIRAETPLTSGDTGFRIFKLASSNIRAWEPDAADLENSLLKNAEHLVQGRTQQDILYELLLKLGLDLCVPVETKTIVGKTVHSIGGGTLIVCLADGLSKDVIEPLASGIVAWRAALAPAVDTRVVFKDSGFADDIAKTNMAAILNQNGITDVRSL